VREYKADSAGLDLFVFGGEGRWQEKEGWVSECYGQRVQAPVWKFSARAAGAQCFISFLMPRAAHAPQSSMREIEAVNGRAFETSKGASRDILLMSDGALAETALMASDFEWAWARFDAGSRTPSELLLINGHHFKLNGLEVLNSPERIQYLFMRRMGEDLYVDSEARPELSGFGAGRLVFTDKMPERTVEYKEAGRSSFQMT
jgi:hypothetical protein